jgi:hypothetical protein
MVIGNQLIIASATEGTIEFDFTIANNNTLTIAGTAPLRKN